MKVIKKFQVLLKNSHCEGLSSNKYENLTLVVLHSSPPSAAYMRQSSGSALVQVMACRLLGAKPLLEPVLACYQLDSWKQISVKFESEFCYFHLKNAFWIVVCQNGHHFIQET